MPGSPAKVSPENQPPSRRFPSILLTARDVAVIDYEVRRATSENVADDLLLHRNAHVPCE